MATISLHGDCRRIEHVRDLLRLISNNPMRNGSGLIDDNIFDIFGKAVRDRTDPTFTGGALVDSNWTQDILRFCSSRKIGMRLAPTDAGDMGARFYVKPDGNIVTYTGRNPSIQINELTHICGLPPGRGISLLRNMVSELRMAAGQGLPPFNPSPDITKWVFIEAGKRAIGIRNVIS